MDAAKIRFTHQISLCRNQFGFSQNLPDEDHELFEETAQKMKESIKYIMTLWDDSYPDNDRVNYKVSLLKQNPLSRPL